jgi:hypothetical protein
LQRRSVAGEAILAENFLGAGVEIVRKSARRKQTG